MKKIILFLFIICFGLTGCGKSIEKTGTTLKDDLGREVTVEKFDNTAVLLGSFAEVWMLAGGTVCATADDAWLDFNLDLPDTCVNLGKTKSLSLEKVISSNPDFIIASANTKQHVEWKDSFENMGVDVAYFDVSNFDDYLRMLKILTGITGREDLFEKNGAAIKLQIEEIIKKSNKRDVKNPKVLFLRASGTYVRAKNSEGSVLGEMLKDLGCVNIADSDTGLLENLSLESIISLNPYHIFVVPVGDDLNLAKASIENMFKENPAWLSLSAVKNNRLYYMDKMLYNLKPNARWGEAYEKLEKLLSQQ